MNPPREQSFSPFLVDEFGRADAHSAVVAPGFLADAPALGNDLQAQTLGQANLLEPGIELLLQRIPLGLQIAKS